MQMNENRILSLKEAARIIYGVDQPTPQQQGKVLEKIRHGQLERAKSKGWNTTAHSVADYLAHKSIQGRDTASSDAAKSALLKGKRKKKPADDPRAGSSELNPIYGNLLHDYFLAVVLRRKIKARSIAFDRAVAAGQAAFLFVVALLVIVPLTLTVSVSAEKRAVRAWLDKNVENGYKIVEWFPPVAQGAQGDTVIRVRYKYYASDRKSILTDRRFLVRDGVVRGLVNAD